MESSSNIFPNNSEELDFSQLDALEFDEVEHVYNLGGTEIPSVTTVMNPLMQDKYSGISQSVLDKAADRGTAIHNSIENFLKYDIDDIEPEYRGYFDAFLRFWEDYQPELVRSEVRMYHKLFLYAGTADLLCFIDGRLVLIDYKSTAEIYEMTCRIQLEAYWQALASFGIVPDEKWILHLRKDGSYRIGRFPRKDNLAWRVFGALKVLYDYSASYIANARQVMEMLKGS